MAKAFTKSDIPPQLPYDEHSLISLHFPLREISSDMPKLCWFAGTRSFLARAEQLGLL